VHQLVIKKNFDKLTTHGMNVKISKTTLHAAVLFALRNVHERKYIPKIMASVQHLCCAFGMPKSSTVRPLTCYS
jgi:uncharacterized membrane protein (UPF0136 family)